MLNILRRRYWYFGISMLVMIPGILAIAMWGLPLAIDFTGGSQLEIKMEGDIDLSTSRIATILDDNGFGDNVVQIADNDVIVIRTKTMDDLSKGVVIEAFEDEFDLAVELLSFESVGPVIGREVAGRAVQAVAIAAFGDQAPEPLSCRLIISQPYP